MKFVSILISMRNLRNFLRYTNINPITLLLNLPGFARLYWRLFWDGRVPLHLKFMLVAAIVYFISPIDLIPETPVELNRLVMRMISPKIADRYQAIREVQKDLKFLSSQSRTTSLPSVQLSSVAQYSSRFSNVIIPEANAIPIDKQIALYFVDTGQVLELDNSKDYKIGRKSKGQSVVPDIDMTPFKAYEWGISRMHARLSTKEGKVMITDMDSANGTWHAGKRIEPETAYELRDGDIFMLGKLRIQVLIPEEAF